MRRLLLGFIGLLIILAGAFYLITRPKSFAADAMPEHTPDIANGERIFWVSGCDSCHSAPGATGDARLVLSGGREIRTIYGLFRVPNISSDRQFGIGSWSARDLANALHYGTSPDGRNYYPALPYASYQRMRLEDIIDLKAFLDTLPASQNAVAGDEPKFPYNIRFAVGLWKLIYLDGRFFTPDPNASDAVNRGAYLVNGPGHCGECHTPRDMFGGMIGSEWLAGAPNPSGKGMIPNITPSPDGIGSWSESDIAYALESGFTPSQEAFEGSMADVQQNVTHLADEDRRAIAAYLKSIPPLPTAMPNDNDQTGDSGPGSS